MTAENPSGSAATKRTTIQGNTLPRCKAVQCHDTRWYNATIQGGTMPRYNVLQCPDTRRYTATKHSDTMQRYKAVNGSAKQNLPYSFMKSELKIMDGGGESMLSSIIPSGLAFWPWPACPEGYGDGPTRTRAPWGRRAAEHAQAEGSNGARPLPGLGVSPRADGSLSQEYLRKLAGCVGSVRRKGVRAPSPGVGAQRSGGYNFHWQVRVPGNLPSAASRPREQPRTDGTVWGGRLGRARPHLDRNHHAGCV